MRGSTPPDARPFKVACPTCGKSATWSAQNPWRPFCSERCRLIDLGAWLAEDNRIPGSEEPGGTPFDPEC